MLARRAKDCGSRLGLMEMFQNVNLVVAWPDCGCTISEGLAATRKILQSLQHEPTMSDVLCRRSSFVLWFWCVLG